MNETDGIRIAAVHTLSDGATGPDDEWIQVVNDGTRSWESPQWILVAEFVGGRGPDSFRFPVVVPDGGWWSFDPGESIYIFTGEGVDTYLAEPPAGHRPQFHFHWNRTRPIWNVARLATLHDQEDELVAPPFPLE